MKRLLDESLPLEPSEQRLAELFAVVPKATPDPLRKRQILARILAKSSGRSRLLGLRWALIGGSLGVATAAAAMVSHQMGYWGVSANPSATVAPPPAQEPVSMQAPKEVENAPPVEQAPAAMPAPSAAARPLGTRAPVASGEDPTLVAAAIHALRNQNNPSKARGLLNQYLKSNPRGALAEEAMALSIEAADAMKDPLSASLGCRYLALYPNGRHRSLASRACSRTTPAK